MIIARQKADLHFGLFIAAFGILTGIVYQFELWSLDQNGFSNLSQRLPYWDFTNLWAGSVLALEGRIHDLFSVEIYRADLRQMFGAALPNQEWSYPPSIVLLGMPLAQLPIGWAYVLWTLLTLAIFYWALGLLSFPLSLRLLLILCPAAWINAIFGQNGALTASLLLAGLAIAPGRQALGGVLLGLLTIKPHLGLLVPICLIASRNYRAFICAAITAGLLFAATGALFGYDVWRLFLMKTGPLMAGIMEADYPQPYHKNAMTGFILARSLRLDVFGAYIMQVLLFIAATAIAVWLWRPQNAIDPAKRVCITAVLSIIATPYGYSYDAIPLCVATAFVFVTELRPHRNVLAIFYLWPLFLHIFNERGVGISILIPIALVAYALLTELKDRPVAVSVGETTAS